MIEASDLSGSSFDEDNIVCAWSRSVMATGDIAALLHGLQEQNARNLGEVMAALQRQQNDALGKILATVQPTRQLTDTRGIGRPIAFRGEERR